MKLPIPVLLAASLLSATAAESKTIYLSCEQMSGHNQIRQDVMVDEDGSTATITTLSTGHVNQNAPAAFKANEIDVNMGLGYHYIIDRVTLASRLTLGTSPLASGKCELVKPSAKRKI